MHASMLSFHTEHRSLYFFFAQGLVQCKWSWRQTVLTVLVSDLYLRLHFHKTDPLLILILCKKMLKHFQIGSFRVNWQTPIFQNGPQNGALNTWVGNFFIKRTLLTFFPAKMVLAGYLAKKASKFEKITCYSRKITTREALNQGREVKVFVSPSLLIRVIKAPFTQAFCKELASP